jgi:4-hydroxybenzoate polyprenyltransferase
MKGRRLPLLTALRTRQWTKNGFVLAAFVFALGDPSQPVAWYDLWRVAAAFLCFCLVSSGVYLVNDVRDRNQDRLHPRKRHRPIAAGDVTVREALATAAVLLPAGLAGGWALSPGLAGILATYLGLQFLYTFALRKVALIDLILVALGFVLRAAAGAVVIRAAISPWLLVCTFLLALFLILCKRRQEKEAAGENHETRGSLRNYPLRLLDQLIAVTAAATLVSYTIYTLSPETVAKFGTHRLSWTLPFVVFGLFRYLDLTYRHGLGEYPEEVLLTDGPLLLDVVLYGLAVLVILLSGGG